MTELELLKDFYQDHYIEYGIDRLGLFGSVARSEATENSDIDIVIELEKPKMLQMIAIKHELEEIFHKKIDLIRLRDNMNPFFRERIMDEAIYV